MLEKINQYIQKELEIFNKLYNRTLHTPTNKFQMLLDFISNQKGKQIRPILLILASKLCGKPTLETFGYAVILELLHVSTLVHDDVIDNTFSRRETPSVMAQFGNKTAVLLGDYILSKAITLSIKTKNFDFLQIMSNLAKSLCEGELNQLVSPQIELLEEDYYLEIIRKKTAVFFSSCLETGALSVNANQEKRKVLQRIGENIGICFQIQDDILDFLKINKVKNLKTNDVIEGQITLPLIYALKRASKAQSDQIIKLIKNQDFSSKNMTKILSFCEKEKGIIYAQKKMIDIQQKIIKLFKFFPSSTTKNYLIEVVNYIIQRKS